MQLAEELSVRLEYVKSQQQAESASLLLPPSSTAFMDVWGIATLVHLCALLLTICIVCSHRPEGHPG